MLAGRRPASLAGHQRSCEQFIDEKEMDIMISDGFSAQTRLGSSFSAAALTSPVFTLRNVNWHPERFAAHKHSCISAGRERKRRIAVPPSANSNQLAQFPEERTSGSLSASNATYYRPPLRR